MPLANRLRSLFPFRCFLVAALSLGLLAGCDTSSSSSSHPPTPPTPGTASAAGCNGSVDPTGGNDPLYQYQWHLQNLGTPGQFAFSDTLGTLGNDINQLAGDFETGCGIKVAVVDTGLQLAQEDLAPNVVPGASSNFNTGGNDPTPTSTGGDHGTSVSGLAAARINNGLGGHGVAGQASLVGYNFLSSSQTDAQWIAALGGVSYSSDVDIFNQSYGVVDGTIDSAVVAQLQDGVTNLRGGKGAIYVKAAGNGFGSSNSNPQNPSGLDCRLANAAGISCQDVNMDEENAIPYNIVVGALNAGSTVTGSVLRSSYSTAGSAIWVSAPGGEFGANASVVGGGLGPVVYEPAMITTDLMGCSAGYAASNIGSSAESHFNLGELSQNGSCNYTSTFNGTSSATPVTVGAIAVLLQKNPNLTWRDVKYILAKSAKQVDSGIAAMHLTSCGSLIAVPAWTPNAALSGVGGPFTFHNWYGFGRVDLDLALATTPPSLGTFIDTGFATQTAAYTIPPCSAVGIQTATLSTTPTPVFIEAVQVNACLTHPNVGQVQLMIENMQTLTTSVILPGQNGFNGVPATPPNNCQTFLTNAFYGETSIGGFRLTAYDTGGSFSSGAMQIDSWQVRVYGH
jgi:subtilisin family serine protease